MSLKAGKGLKQRSREQCKAQTKAGGAGTYRRISIWVNLARLEMLSTFGKTVEMHAAMNQFSLLFGPKSDEAPKRLCWREEKPSLEDRRRGSSANSVEEYW